MLGRITKLISGDYSCIDYETNKEYVVKPLGIFRNRGISPKVGDIIEFDKLSILDVKKRSNDFIRPSICNIDQAIIVSSLKEPDLNLNLLDKFLVNFEFNRISPIIVFTKADLLTKEEFNNILPTLNYYSKIGYRTIISFKESRIKEELKPLIENKLSVITGDSGTGKSTLLTLLDSNLELKTNEISKALNRGKHTTRHTEIHPLLNGFIADTPGFGNLELSDFTVEDLSHNFVEFFEYSTGCKYPGCVHVKEPNCRIKEFVEKGVILKSRYENYLSFIEEIKNNRKW